MKRHELQKPLVQSALVLLAILLLIGFVAGSNAHGVLDGVVSIVKGAFLTLLFAIALIIALLISIALLVGVFLGAVAIYSPQASGEMYGKLRHSLSTFISSWSHSAKDKQENIVREENDLPRENDGQKLSAAHVMTKSASSEKDQRQLIEDVRKELSAKIATIDRSLAQLKEDNQSVSQAVEDLENSVKEMPFTEVRETSAKLEADQQEISAKFSDHLDVFKQISNSVQKNETALEQQNGLLQDAQKKIDTLSSEIKNLSAQQVSAEENTETSSPTQDEEEQPRIFAYIAAKKDQKALTEAVKQATAKDMTYAEIDEFLSKSLPKNIDDLLKEHPSLTKDFIRSFKAN